MIGSAVVSELLLNRELYDDLSVTVLSRSKTEKDARKRLYNVCYPYFEKLNPERLNLLETVDVVLGDLNDVGQWQDCSDSMQQVTHVLNIAGDTRFGRRQDEITNTRGLWSFADKMGRTGKTERFCHVGTAYMCGEEMRGRDCVMEEELPEREMNTLVTPYHRSKALGEMELRRRHASSFDSLVVARPSVVSGDSRMGLWANGSLYWIVKASSLLQSCFWPLERKLDVIPYDYVSRALLFMTLKPEVCSGVYHVSAGEKSCEWNEVLSVASKRNAREHVSVLPSYEEFAAHLKKENHPDIPLQLYLRAMRYYGVFCDLGVTFSNRKLIDIMKEPPPLFPDYIDVCETICNPMWSNLEKQIEWDI